MNLGIVSFVSAIVAAVLVFVDYFRTPPLAIAFFSILAIVLGIFSPGKNRASWAGLFLGLFSLAYLVYLFLALGA